MKAIKIIHGITGLCVLIFTGWQVLNGITLTFDTDTNVSIFQPIPFIPFVVSSLLFGFLLKYNGFDDDTYTIHPMAEVDSNLPIKDEYALKIKNGYLLLLKKIEDNHEILVVSLYVGNITPNSQDWNNCILDILSTHNALKG